MLTIPPHKLDEFPLSVLRGEEHRRYLSNLGEPRDVSPTSVLTSKQSASLQSADSSSYQSEHDESAFINSVIVDAHAVGNQVTAPTSIQTTRSVTGPAEGTRIKTTYHARHDADEYFVQRLRNSNQLSDADLVKLDAHVGGLAYKVVEGEETNHGRVVDMMSKLQDRRARDRFLRVFLNTRALYMMPVKLQERAVLQAPLDDRDLAVDVVLSTDLRVARHANAAAQGVKPLESLAISLPADLQRLELASHHMSYLGNRDRRPSTSSDSLQGLVEARITRATAKRLRSESMSKMVSNDVLEQSSKRVRRASQRFDV